MPMKNALCYQEGSGHEDDPAAQVKQVHRMFIGHSDRVFKEIDDENHDDHLADLRLEVIEVAHAQPSWLSCCFSPGWVDLTDKEFIDAHAEDQQDRRKEIVIDCWDERQYDAFVVGRRGMELRHHFPEGTNTLNNLDAPFQEHNKGCNEGADHCQQHEETTIEQEVFKDTL